MFGAGMDGGWVVAAMSHGMAPAQSGPGVSGRQGPPEFACHIALEIFRVPHGQDAEYIRKITPIPIHGS